MLDDLIYNDSPEGLRFIINKLKSSSIQSPRQQAYVIATIKLETNYTYEPVVEGYWLGANRIRKLFKYYQLNNPKALKTIFPHGYYPTYEGRGYVQVTHDFNYQMFSNKLGLDLVHNPDLALEPETAWKICELGMTQGLFTGKKLSDYFTEDETHWYDARRIINGTDRAKQFADTARIIYEIMEGFNSEIRGIDKWS